MARPQDPVNKTIDALNGIVDRAPELLLKIKDLLGKENDKKKKDPGCDAAQEDGEA